MKKINMNYERCKACHLCLVNCPKQAIYTSGKVNQKGYEYVLVDEDKCIACGSCYQMCPDFVFEILQ